MLLNIKNLSLSIFSIFFLLNITACELSDSDKENINNAFTPPPVADPIDDSVDSQLCETERFVQPEAEIVKKIDILFVVDTSGSMNAERVAIADGIDAFVKELPADVDYNVGVVYGHGEEVNRSGELTGSPSVLKSSELSLPDIRTKLRQRMNNPLSENSTDGGEVSLYALTQALTTKLSKNKAAGFFRDDAALAVVFVADENDICSLGSYPQGITPVYDPDRKEASAFNKYCSGVTPQNVVSSIKSVKNGKPYLVSGIVYNGIHPVPQMGENELGYGYLETIALANGVSIDLASGQYDLGMREIGFLAYKKLNLITEFNLARADFMNNSLKVFVDRQLVNFNYVQSLNQVQIAEADAGHEKSEILIKYCLPMLPPPQILNLRVFRITFTTANIEWETDHPTTEKLTVTEVASGTVVSTLTDNQFKKIHALMLTGLKDNTLYEVRIEATNPEGLSSQKLIQFNTLNEQAFLF